MLNNCQYNKIKMLKKLSCVLWFIKKHAEKDAEDANDVECIAFLDKLGPDLEEHIKKLKSMICK